MSKIFTQVKYGILAVIIGLALFHATGMAQGQDAPERSLEGVWVVKTTPRNCATGIPNPTAAFEALYTFNTDGTGSASIRNSSLTVTRSPFHGLWRRELGWSDYSFRFVHIRWTTLTGAFAGKQEASGALVLSESGNEFMTDGLNKVFDIDGNLIITGCANSAGTRFTLE
jgi:hypothetical protein